MSGIKLTNAPLKEAIFEIFWSTPNDKTGFPTDKEYELAQGRFDVEIKKLFPIYKRLIPYNSPIKVFRHPVHQFWKNHLQWPVVQLGPGIMTINEVESSYIWDEFRNNIIASLNILLKSYLESPPFERLSLKYIDSKDLPDGSSVFDFINKNFRTNFTNSFDLPGDIIGLNFNQTFRGFDDSNIHLNIQTAINNFNGKAAIVWITLVEKNGTFNLDDILKWIDKAHDICSELFKKTLNEEFYETFHK